MSQYTTYSRSILSDFKKIAELLQKHSAAHRGVEIQFDPNITALPIIPAILLDEALANPQNHFLQFIIRSFSGYAKAHKELFEQRQQVVELQSTLTRLQQEIKAKSNDVDDGTRIRLENTLETLAHHQKALNNLAANITSNRQQLNEQLAKLAEMAERHDQAWEAFRAEGNDSHSNDKATALEQQQETEAGGSKKQFDQITTTIQSGAPFIKAAAVATQAANDQISQLVKQAAAQPTPSPTPTPSGDASQDEEV
ncbi:MAG: hypothetical protein M3R00_03480 [Pseudomonadota bacterium]|nr:hypothetical protein [Pseudomonadota bacterium]